MKIGLIGWYGHANLGDERILDCLKRYFFQHEVLPMRSLSEAMKNIPLLNSCDFVLLGGGGLILRNMNGYIPLLEKITKPFGCVGISVEAVHEDNIFFIEMLKEKALFILVRDQSSKELLKNHFKVIHSADLTFLYPYPVAEMVQEDICCLNLRNWPFWQAEHGGVYARYMQALSAQRNDLYNSYPHAKWDPDLAVAHTINNFAIVRPLPLYFEEGTVNDVEELKKFFSKINWNDDPIALLSTSRYFLSMRLHGLIFACQMGIPFLSLDYQPKNKVFCEEMGLSELGVNIYDPDKIPEKIDYLKAHYGQIKEKLLAVRESAQKDIEGVMRTIFKFIAVSVPVSK